MKSVFKKTKSFFEVSKKINPELETVKRALGMFLNGYAVIEVSKELEISEQTANTLLIKFRNAFDIDRAILLSIKRIINKIKTYKPY